MNRPIPTALRAVRAAASELLERGELNAEEYGAAAAATEEMLEQVTKVAAYLERQLPAGVISSVCASMMLAVHAGDEMAVRKQVQQMQTLSSAVRRRL
jgi:hypothetical protein